jgi:hypothetical protein
MMLKCCTWLCVWYQVFPFVCVGGIRGSEYEALRGLLKSKSRLIHSPINTSGVQSFVCAFCTSLFSMTREKS